MKIKFKISACWVVPVGIWFGMLGHVRADILVTDWSLATRTYNPGESEFQSALQLTVQNPFQATDTASIENSYSTVTYDFAWTGDEAHFDVFPTHYLQELDGLTISEGRITLTPAVKSVMTFSGTWTYAWPSAAIGGSSLGFSVFDVAVEEPIAEDYDSGGNFDLGPPFGTLTIAGSAILRAGRSHLIGYSARIDHFTPTPPGTHGDASGEIHFTIFPIPEPATIALLTPALVICRRRRSRRSR